MLPSDILKKEYEIYVNVINKILLNAGEKINKMEYDEDFPLFDHRYSIPEYMNLDIQNLSNETLLSMMKNTCLEGSSFLKNNTGSVKSIYNLSKSNSDKNDLIDAYKNFLISLISYKKLSLFYDNLSKKNENIEFEKEDIENFLKKFNYKDPHQIAELIDLIAYNKILKNYISTNMNQYLNINFLEEIKDFDFTEQLLHLMFIKIPPMNLDINIKQYIRNTILTIFKKSQYLNNTLEKLHNKNSKNIVKCNTCNDKSRNKYIFTFSFNEPDNIINYKVYKNDLLKHIIHIVAYGYETIFFYLKPENSKQVFTKLDSYKHNILNENFDNNKLLNELKNYLNKYALNNFNVDNVINIFTKYYDDLYKILIDAENINWLKLELINIINFIDIEIDIKKKCIDFMIDHLYLHVLDVIKNNPDKILSYKIHIQKVLLIIKKKNGVLGK
jgi:hypothetical protein